MDQAPLVSIGLLNSQAGDGIYSGTVTIGDQNHIQNAGRFQMTNISGSHNNTDVWSGALVTAQLCSSCHSDYTYETGSASKTGTTVGIKTSELKGVNSTSDNTTTVGNKTEVTAKESSEITSISNFGNSNKAVVDTGAKVSNVSVVGEQLTTSFTGEVTCLNVIGACGDERIFTANDSNKVILGSSTQKVDVTNDLTVGGNIVLSNGSSIMCKGVPLLTCSSKISGTDLSEDRPCKMYEERLAVLERKVATLEASLKAD
jgi:hypothetical protein